MREELAQVVDELLNVILFEVCPASHKSAGYAIHRTHLHHFWFHDSHCWCSALHHSALLQMHARVHSRVYPLHLHNKVVVRACMQDVSQRKVVAASCLGQLVSTASARSAGIIDLVSTWQPSSSVGDKRSSAAGSPIMCNFGHTDTDQAHHFGSLAESLVGAWKTNAPSRGVLVLDAQPRPLTSTDF
jgi:hypothetical protein